MNETTWLDWPDSPGPWWMQYEGTAVVCEAFATSDHIRVMFCGAVVNRATAGPVEFQKVLPPDSVPPDWHDRPTCAGTWLCSLNHDGKIRPTVVTLDDNDIAAGKPFYTPRVYGPIPEDTP